MATKAFPKQTYRQIGFVVFLMIFGLWIASQAVGQVVAADRYDGRSASAEAEVATEETVGWFIVEEESQWMAQEITFVEQIMEHTWQALDGAGLAGQDLLDGYRFRRVAAEFVPGQERLLAMVDHERMEIILADGAFKRLHGFYIYHELGHAVDRQLERLPSEGYHRIAGEAQEGTAEGGDTWTTVTGFWLRYHGRDDREEATADAFAWWVMAQAGQPRPFFPGTPPATDYDQIARTIEESVRDAAAIGFQPA